METTEPWTWNYLVPNDSHKWLRDFQLLISFYMISDFLHNETETSEHKIATGDIKLILQQCKG